MDDGDDDSDDDVRGSNVTSPFAIISSIWSWIVAFFCCARRRWPASRLPLGLVRTAKSPRTEKPERLTESTLVDAVLSLAPLLWIA